MVCRRRRVDSAMVRAGRSQGTWYLGRGPGRGVWFCHEECSNGLRVYHLARAIKSSADDRDLAAVCALGTGRGRL